MMAEQSMEYFPMSVHFDHQLIDEKTGHVLD